MPSPTYQEGRPVWRFPEIRYMKITQYHFSTHTHMYTTNGLHTSSRWLNCTVVGFSERFFGLGLIANRSSGIHCPPILGKELYTSPASSPATNAPEAAQRRENNHNQQQQGLHAGLQVTKNWWRPGTMKLKLTRKCSEEYHGNRAMCQMPECLQSGAGCL